MSQKCPHKQENRPSKEQLVDLITMKGPRERGGHARKPGAQPPPGRGPCDQPLGMEKGQEEKTWKNSSSPRNRGPVNRGAGTTTSSRPREHETRRWALARPRAGERGWGELRDPQRVRTREGRRTGPQPPLGLSMARPAAEDRGFWQEGKKKLIKKLRESGPGRRENRDHGLLSASR